MRSIQWEGRTITVDDWDDNRSGYLVFQASSFKWNGTPEGLATSLLAYLNGLPSKSLLCWPRTTIECLHLSGSLAFDNQVKECTVFPARSYGVTKQEMDEYTASRKDEEEQRPPFKRTTTEDERKMAFLKWAFGGEKSVLSIYEAFSEGARSSVALLDQKIEDATELDVLRQLIRSKYEDVEYPK